MARKECSIAVVGRKGVVEVGESVCVFVLSAQCGVRVLTPENLRKEDSMEKGRSYLAVSVLLRKCMFFLPALAK